MTKVGFFDSGVGGRCILNAFLSICPDAKTIYLSDSAHCPYGNRTANEVRTFTEKFVVELIYSGCEIIVIACNTATAASIEYLRKKYPSIKFVGLEPAIKTAAKETRTNTVAVLATQGTFEGRLYKETKSQYASNINVIEVVAQDFVVEVEKLPPRGIAAITGEQKERLYKVVGEKINPLLAAGADMIVLGCTHFPHLKDIIENICNKRAQVIDSSEAVARHIMELYKCQ